MTFFMFVCNMQLKMMRRFLCLHAIYNYRYRCIFVNKNIVSSFFPFKDQIPLMTSSYIIYKYSCG